MDLKTYLDISKNKSYNPVALKKRIDTALELISISDPKPANLIIIGLFLF